MTVQQKSAFWIGGFAVFLILLFLLRDMLLPFAAGMVLAYFLDPVCDYFEAKGASRAMATTIVTAIFFSVFFLVLALAMPLIFDQINGFAQRLPGYVDNLQNKVLPHVIEFAGRFGLTEVEDLAGTVAGHTGSAVRWIAGFISNLVGGLGAFVNLLSLLLITPIVAFYLLRDWDLITAKIDGWLPRSNADIIREQVSEVDRTLSGFIRGQASVCVILGSFYGVALLLVGLEFGLIVGFMTGIISFIPYFGMLIGFVVGMALAIAQFADIVPIAMVAVVFGIGQILEGYVLTPRLVGGRVGLHPVWIIFSLLAGASLFGFLGVLLAVPVAAVIGVLVRFFLSQYLQSALYDPDAYLARKLEQQRRYTQANESQGDNA